MSAPLQEKWKGLASEIRLLVSRADREADGGGPLANEDAVEVRVDTVEGVADALDKAADLATDAVLVERKFRHLGEAMRTRFPGAAAEVLALCNILAATLITSTDASPENQPLGDTPPVTSNDRKPKSETKPIRTRLRELDEREATHGLTKAERAEADAIDAELRGEGASHA